VIDYILKTVRGLTMKEFKELLLKDGRVLKAEYDKNGRYHYNEMKYFLFRFGSYYQYEYIVIDDNICNAIDNLFDYFYENEKNMLFTDKELQEIKQDAINDGEDEDYYLNDFMRGGEYLSYARYTSYMVVEINILNKDILTKNDTVLAIN